MKIEMPPEYRQQLSASTERLLESLQNARTDVVGVLVVTFLRSPERSGQTGLSFGVAGICPSPVETVMLIGEACDIPMRRLT